MRSIKPGRGPSALQAALSVFAILFGIFWTVATFSLTRNSPFPSVVTILPLFGVLFVLIGIAQLIYNLKKFGDTGNQGSLPIAARLKSLEELKSKGLITPAEYEAKRKAIIDEL